MAKAQRHRLSGQRGGRRPPELRGEIYRDASGNSSLPLLVFQAGADGLAGVPACALYTADMFQTGNDADIRAAVSRVEYGVLPLVGLAFRDERRVVDKVVKGLKLHT